MANLRRAAVLSHGRLTAPQQGDTLTPMETPLTPLEFARRARRLYAKPRSGRRRRAAADLRTVLRRVAIAGRRRFKRSASAAAIGSPTSHRTRTRQLESFYAVPQIGAVLVPINFRLTAADFAYIINHSGASVVCVASDLSCGR